MTQKMTLTQALSEVKLLTKRIDLSKSLIAVQLGSEDQEGVKKLESQLKANLQSSTDLLNRLMRIRQAITKANSETVVQVGEKQMTVIEAIERKKHLLPQQKSLLQVMKNQLSNAERDLANRKAQFERDLDARLAALKTDKANPVDENLLKVTRDHLAKSSYPTLIDPLNLASQIERLEHEVNDFELNVDVALSIVNARTEIEV